MAAVLYMLYTRPQTVPGDRGGQARARSVAATLDAMPPDQPGPVSAGQTPAGQAGQGPAAAARAGAGAGGTAAPAGQAGSAGGSAAGTAENAAATDRVEGTE